MKLLITFPLLFYYFLVPIQVIAGDWELEKDRDNIQVYTKIIEGWRYKSFRGITYHDASNAKLISVMDDVSTYPDWLYLVTESELLETTSETETLVYIVMELPWPCNDRDGVVRVTRADSLESASLLYRFESMPSQVPRREGFTRVLQMDGFMSFSALENNQRQIVIQLSMDPGGSIPAWLLNALIVEVPFESLTSLKVELER